MEGIAAMIAAMHLFPVFVKKLEKRPGRLVIATSNPTPGTLSTFNQVPESEKIIVVSLGGWDSYAGLSLNEDVRFEFCCASDKKEFIQMVYDRFNRSWIQRLTNFFTCHYSLKQKLIQDAK